MSILNHKINDIDINTKKNDLNILYYGNKILIVEFKNTKKQHCINKSFYNNLNK